MKPRTIFMGYGSGIVNCCEAAKEKIRVAGIFTQSEKFYKDNRSYLRMLEKLGLYKDVPAYCLERGIEMKRNDSVNSKDSIEWFKSKKPDLIVCYSLWEIVQDEFLNEFENVFNIHGANLPNYMGRAPQSWAILNGEKFLGITIHKMTIDLDQGPIAWQQVVDILDNDRPIDILKRQKQALIKIFPDFIDAFVNGTIDFRENKIEEGSYWPKLNSDIQGEIDWSWETGYIERQARAFGEPYNGSFFKFKEKKCRVIKCETPQPNRKISPFAGIVFGKTKDGAVKVTTGDGYLLIREVMLDDKKYPASEIIRLGTRL